MEGVGDGGSAYVCLVGVGRRRVVYMFMRWEVCVKLMSINSVF